MIMTVVSGCHGLDHRHHHSCRFPTAITAWCGCVWKWLNLKWMVWYGLIQNHTKYSTSKYSMNMVFHTNRVTNFTQCLHPARVTMARDMVRYMVPFLCPIYWSWRWSYHRRTEAHEHPDDPIASCRHRSSVEGGVFSISDLQLIKIPFP